MTCQASKADCSPCLKLKGCARSSAALILQQTFQERAPYEDTGCHLARQLPWHAAEHCPQCSQAVSGAKGSMALTCQACKQAQGSCCQANACPGTPLDARAGLTLRADAWVRTELRVGTCLLCQHQHTACKVTQMDMYMRSHHLLLRTRSLHAVEAPSSAAFAAA